MARGGGGGGRGGGGGGRSFSGARYRSASQNDQTTPMNKFVDFIFTTVIIILVLSISSGNSRASYDETKLSDFASNHYEASFGNTESYEDNLLLAFVVYEDCEQFSYMTWVGDHIGPDAFQYLQGEGTWLDIMLSRQVGPTIGIACQRIWTGQSGNWPRCSERLILWGPFPAVRIHQATLQPCETVLIWT